MKKKLIVAALAAAFITSNAQHTLPNSWTGLYGAAQGFPQERSGRMIHAIHTAPTNLQMGSVGKIVFFGRSNNAGGPVQPHTWVPPMALDAGSNGTFGRTSLTTVLDYEAFCCGQTLMEDGKIVITGSNFRNGPYPQEPGPEVATYDPATNLWTKSPIIYELNRLRYYPSTIKMPDGRIVTLGGQATDPGDLPIDPEFVDRPFEINPDTLNVLAVWQMKVR